MYFPIDGPMSEYARAVWLRESNLGLVRKKHLNEVMSSAAYWNGVVAIGQGAPIRSRVNSHCRLDNSNLPMLDNTSSLANFVRYTIDAPIDLHVPMLNCSENQL